MIAALTAKAIGLALTPLASGAVELEPLPERQRTVAILVAVGTLLLVLELVRRRKLREEYSWFWACTAMLLIVLAVYEGCLVELSRWIGAASTVSTLFFGAFVFLMILGLQFSIRLSRLTHRNRTMAQRLALLEQEVARLRGEPRSEQSRSEQSRSEQSRAEQSGSAKPRHGKTGKERDEVA